MLGGSSLSAQQQPDSNGIYKVGHGVRAPKPVYHPEPEYSDKGRKNKISGSVLLSMIVTEEGLTRDVKVTEGLEKSLDQQAIAAVSTWKFEPATLDGKAVPVYMKVEVTFKTYN
jgi:periplasmic protein TonB